jgi:hypothetical protein
MNNTQLVSELMLQVKAQHDEGYRAGRAHGLFAGAVCGALVGVALMLVVWLGLS